MHDSSLIEGGGKISTQDYYIGANGRWTQTPHLSRPDFLAEMRAQHAVLLNEEDIVVIQVNAAKKALLNKETLLMDTRDQRVALEVAISNLDPAAQADIGEVTED